MFVKELSVCRGGVEQAGFAGARPNCNRRRGDQENSEYIAAGFGR